VATHPEYIAPLREEIEALITAGGWKKATLSKMNRLDSFIKESIRCHPVASRARYNFSFY
jgi:hypothetical protein